MRIFFDVDTQNDFMNKDGALYVPNAELIKPNLEKLTKYSFKKGIQLFGSLDLHSEQDKELKRNGGPFPDHCMNETDGWCKIKETIAFEKVHHLITESCILFMDWNLPTQDDYHDYRNIIDWLKLKNNKKAYHGIFFFKNTYDIFANKSLKKYLNDFGVKEAVVYGVATDYCVKAAALGLRKQGIEIYIVTDAIKAVDEKAGKAALEEMTQAGAKFVTTEEVINPKI